MCDVMNGKEDVLIMTTTTGVESEELSAQGQHWIITAGDPNPKEIQEFHAPVTVTAPTTHYRPLLIKVSEDSTPIHPHHLQEEVPACSADVVTASLKELRLKGSSFLRTHASKHGITNASRKLTSQVLAELTRHYATAHRVRVIQDDFKEGPPPSVNPPSKSNTSKKKSGPGSGSSYIPSTKSTPLQLEGMCKAEVLAKSRLELSACGTSLLRPEAASHKVHNASRKPKDIVIEELWQHYICCHPKEILQWNDGK